MPRTVEIVLSEPVISHSGPVTKLVLREPKYRDYIELGPVISYARNADGMVFSAERMETFNSYFERLLIEPPNPLLLSQLSLVDALRLQEVVSDFFMAAQMQVSKASEASSSSTSSSPTSSAAAT